MLSQDLERYLKDLDVYYSKENHNVYLVKNDYLLLTIKCKEDKATITFRPNSRECSRDTLDKIQYDFSDLVKIKEYIENK